MAAGLLLTLVEGSDELAAGYVQVPPGQRTGVCAAGEHGGEGDAPPPHG